MKSLKLPVPAIQPHAAPFWDGAKKGKLVLPFCSKCEKLFFYPRIACPECFSEEISWREVSKRGRIETFTTLYRAPTEAFETILPYSLGMIRLECDLLMFMGIKGEKEKIKIGAAGEVQLETRADVAIPYFLVL